MDDLSKDERGLALWALKEFRQKHGGWTQFYPPGATKPVNILTLVAKLRSPPPKGQNNGSL